MLNYDARGNIIFEGALLYFKNFRAVPKPNGPANPEKSFGIILEPEDAEKLKSEGWNIKYSVPDQNGNITAYLPVAARFDKFPPLVEVYSSTGKRVLSEETVGELDQAMFTVRPDGRPWIDIVVHGSKWTKGKNSGIKAYLNQARFGVVEDNSFAKDWDSYSINEPPEDLDTTPF